MATKLAELIKIREVSFKKRLVLKGLKTASTIIHFGKKITTF